MLSWCKGIVVVVGVSGSERVDVVLRLVKEHQTVDANGRRKYVDLHGVNDVRYVVPEEMTHRVGRDHPLHWFVRRVGMSP